LWAVTHHRIHPWIAAAATLLYTLIAGLGEILILGVLNGLALKPSM